MKKRNHKKIFITIIILSLVGILTSLYLLNSHYSHLEAGSVCDINEQVSCTLVNSSQYSELFNIPVALLGGIWFIVLILMAWRSLGKSKIESTILAWNILGILFVAYLILAEILLGSICPFCTVVHVIVLVTLILSIKLFKERDKKSKSLFSQAKPWIILAVILNLLPLILFNISFGGGEKIDYSPLAQCIDEKGVNMYGSFRCAVCAKTRDMFGDAFEHINEIECHPQGENPQTALCLEKGVEGTPTWILEPNGEELDRRTGFLSIEELKEFSGCENV